MEIHWAKKYYVYEEVCDLGSLLTQPCTAAHFTRPWSLRKAQEKALDFQCWSSNFDILFYPKHDRYHAWQQHETRSSWFAFQVLIH